MSQRSRFRLIGAIAMIILIAISISIYRAEMRRSREAILRVNLEGIRSVLKQYRDNKKAVPQSLASLVDAGYFRELPMDPITHSNSTWEPVFATIVLPSGQSQRGITDIHSGSRLVSSNGTSYQEW